MSWRLDSRRKWILLGLAVLTKGPVAVVLVGATLLLFGWLQADLTALVRRLRPLRGLLLTALVTLPWYALALWRDGRELGRAWGAGESALEAAVRGAAIQRASGAAGPPDRG